MKKVFVFTFLIVFALRPSYYVSQMLYYALNIDYIVENYCINIEKPKLKCNGKCHLSQQLALIDSDDTETSMISIYESFFPVFSENPLSTQINRLFQSTLLKQKIEFASQHYCFNFSSSHFKPPIV